MNRFKSVWVHIFLLISISEYMYMFNFLHIKVANFKCVENSIFMSA